MQKTVDFHTHLMEFDIPDTLHWHTLDHAGLGARLHFNAQNR